MKKKNTGLKPASLIIGILVLLVLILAVVYGVTSGWANPFARTGNFTDALVEKEGTIYPLKVSESGRYLVTQKGSPYLIFADTGWMIFSSLSDEDVEYFLDDRHAKDVNTILCYIPPWDMDRANKAGEKAFQNDDVSTPNEAYFSHVDWVIRQAAARNMQVIINPASLSNYTDYFTPVSARELGRYVGSRYKDFPNLIWFMGGDIGPSGKQPEIIREMAAGIMENDPDHLITMHPRGLESSSMYFHNDDWLDFNMYQTYERGSIASYTMAVDDYNLTPIKPTINIEPDYEGERGTTALDVRKSAGWSFFSGTMGISYGAAWIWMFDYRGDPWKDNMNLPGLYHLQIMADALASRNWSLLAPNLERSMLTSGNKTFGAYEYGPAALARDGSFGMAYFPTARPVTIDMSQFNGKKTIKWLDPTNGAYTIVGKYPNSGSQDLPAQPDNSAGDPDWILIVE